MKFLFIAPRYHTNQLEIVRTLLSRGHDVRFASTLVGVGEDHTLIKPILLPESLFSKAIRKVFGDGDVNLQRFFPKPLDCWRLFREFSPDVVVIRLHGTVFAYLSALIARLTGCKAVFYQQMDPTTLQALHKGGGRARLRRANFHGRLIAFDAAWMTPLPAGPGNPGKLPTRSYFVPFAVPVKERTKKRKNEIRFLVVGKYQTRKRHMLMVEAVASLARKYSFSVTFIGEASTEEHATNLTKVRQAIASMSLERVITLLDAISHAEMENLYQAHDVFVLPSSNEPASVSVLEAMGQGMPVICSDSCGTGKYVVEGSNGFIFASGDRGSLARALEKFLADPTICDRMSQYTIDFARRNISPEAFYHSFREMLISRFGMDPDGGRSKAGNDQDIAFVLDAGFSAGGAERVAATLITGWINEGRKVTLITMRGVDKDVYQSPIGMDRIVLGGPRPPANKFAALVMNLGDVIRLRRVLKQLRAPVIISFLTIPNIRTVLAASTLGKRVIISERIDTTREKQFWFWHTMRRLVYRFASVVTANSHVALDSMSAYVPSRKLSYVPNPVVIPKHSATPEDSHLILNVGRLVFQKNQALLIEALACLGHRIQDWSAEVLGGGPEEDRLRSQIQALGLEDRIHLRGVVPDPGPYYRAAAMFVLTSRYEGTPNAMLEAMAHGLPCLVPDDLPGAIQFIEDGFCGLTFTSGDAADLAAKIVVLMGNPPLRKKLGDSARTRMQDLSLEKVLSVWEGLGVGSCVG